MAKSNRRRKQDRAKAASGRAERERARARAAREREVTAGYARLLDPRTSPAEVAELLLDITGPTAAEVIMLARQESGVTAEELAETARLMLADAPEPPPATALAVAGWAAHQAGEEEAERRYTDELLASRAEGIQRIGVIGSISQRGHPGQACEQIEPYLREYPDDADVIEVYAGAIARAHADPDQRGEAERGALDRFASRDGIDALRAALDDFLDRTDWGAWVRERLDRDLAPASKKIPAADRDMLDAIMFETAIDSPRDGHQEGERDRALTAFAALPDLAPELRVRASDWDRHVHYGVWQVRDPEAAPGLWCTDLLTGVRRYAQFPAAALDGAVRWAAWLGGLVPVDGIWRSTGSGLWLSPMEGDAIAEFADDSTQATVEALLSGGSPRDQGPEQIRFGSAEPYCVQWDSDLGDIGPEAAGLLSEATAAMLAGLAAQILAKRHGPGVQLTNTEGEPLVNIDATIAIKGDVTERLLDDDDFSVDAQDDSQIAWWGERVFPAEPDEYYLRGRLTPGDGRIRAQVNSEQRLRLLLRILSDYGGEPRVTEQRRAEPSVDFAWGPVPDGGQGWEKNWAEQPVMALNSLTPRQAASLGEGHDLEHLEALLRQLEYQSARGEHVIDVPWLRQELGAEAGLPGAFCITRSE